MENAKFVLTAVGAFISVSGLFFAVFQFWVKKREEKEAAFQASIRNELEHQREVSRSDIQHERGSRKEDLRRFEARIEQLEKTITSDLVGRIAKMEGSLLGVRSTLDAMQRWFIDSGSK